MTTADLSYDLRSTDGRERQVQAILAGTGAEHTLQDLVQWDRGPRWVLASKITGLALALGDDDGRPWEGVETVPPPLLDALAKIGTHDLQRDPDAVAHAIEDLRSRGLLGPLERPGKGFVEATGSVMVWKLEALSSEAGVQLDIPQSPPPDSFADHPMTLGEQRAQRSQRADDWTPRDLLVKLLREHDSGEAVLTDLVVSFQTAETSGFWSAAANRLTALGLASSLVIGIGTSGVPE